MKITSILFVLVVFNYLQSYCCTMGVASGKATADGRPMLWKTRDYEVKPNIVFFTKTEKYSFVSNITPEYGYDRSWFGLNEKGFAIANTFIRDYPERDYGLGNGQFMNEALTKCVTVGDFEMLLKQTNKTGRATRATFGVIDAKGGAVIFEVGPGDFVKFDTNDKDLAPDGYLVRTNFTMKTGGTRGKKRYERSTELVADLYKNNNLCVKSILHTQMRDLNLSHREQVEGDFFNCRQNICTPNSISATVIQGVKKGEPEYLSTMWTMLGSPFASIAVPYWPVGKTPKVSSTTGHESLYGISSKIKSQLFTPENNSFVNIRKATKIKEKLFTIENSILEETNTLLENWRASPVNEGQMLNAENRFANLVFSELKKIHSVANENGSSSIIKIDKFPLKGYLDGDRTISISLPPNYHSGKEKYRVIYFFDGGVAFAPEEFKTNSFAANCYHDSLYHKDLIYPAILVGIHHNGRRFSDLTPTKGGKLEQMYKFIDGVLKPYIDTNYRTLKTAEFTGIAGNSLGGLAAAWLALMYPETFGMAGIMSPSLWFDDNLLVKKIESEDFQKIDSRLWIMASDLEFPGMRENARHFAITLKDKGWEEGKDLAFYQVYDGYHGERSCNTQMEEMLYFLLRKKEPKLLGVQVNNLKSPAMTPIDIETLGEYASVFLELQYENRFRINALSPEYLFSDTGIVSIQDNIGCRLIPIKDGNTTLTMAYNNMKSSVKIQSFNFNDYKRNPVTPSEKSIKVDGDISEWGKLKFKLPQVATGKNKDVLYFDTTYDESFLYLSFHITDDTFIANPYNRRSPQDHTIIYFDARPDPYRMLGRGQKAWDLFNLFQVFPVHKGEQTILRKRRSMNSRIPEGLQVASRINDQGYDVEIGIPTKYLEEEQGKNWSEFRLNINQVDVDEKGGKVKFSWWQPNWTDEKNINGSGSFKVNGKK